jgi:hypothetical protein
MRQHPLPILVCIRLLARVHVGRAIPQHALDQPGQLLRGRRHRFGGPEPGPAPTGIGPQGPGTVGAALGRQPHGRRRPMGRRCAPYPAAFTPCYFVARTSPAPRRPMRARRPAGPSKAQRTQHLQGRAALEPIDLGPVPPGHRSEIGPHLKARRVAAA